MDVVFGGFGFGGEVLDEDVFVDLAIGGDGFVEWLSMEMALWMWSLVDVVLVVTTKTRSWVEMFGFSHWWRWFCECG